MKIQNPHDKYFKETFGKVAVARDFLHNYLPRGILDIIDINTLEPQKDSFINEELQESCSDLLFKAGIKEGIEAGIEKGETKALVRTAIKLLTKKFGSLPVPVTVGKRNTKSVQQ